MQNVICFITKVTEQLPLHSKNYFWCRLPSGPVPPWTLIFDFPAEYSQLTYTGAVGNSSARAKFPYCESRGVTSAFLRLLERVLKVTPYASHYRRCLNTAIREKCHVQCKSQATSATEIYMCVWFFSPSEALRFNIKLLHTFVLVSSDFLSWFKDWGLHIVNWTEVNLTH